ncbi:MULTISPECIES: alpha/beta hydrolase [unclassified Crossiella]|uniref:alpha/beta hydrolase n=1 Tax=unclassified Crossiella TaxID=2620835 RepID=UPI001FFEDCF9|nr:MULTISPECIES: alpha/beta hydrolase [unclassified Crossiella]MCK2239807.1 alpha/beta hydrolase family protein [Crossiella sp. S99.2]MCK2252502.1 alpha/beta hydrolase family protein [Crossiella sp. S99.1]
MTTVEELRDAEPTVFTRAAQRWQDLAADLTTRATEVTRHLRALSAWRGAAAEAARTQITGHHARLSTLSEALTRIPPVLREAGEHLTRLQTSLRTALGTAHQHNLRVASDGQVTDDAVAIAKPPPPGAATKAQLCATLTTALRDTLRTAGSVDAEAAAALRRLTQDATGVTPGQDFAVCTTLTAAVPAHGTAPAQVKQWWDSLSIADRETLLATDGARIGALDGIPAAVRDRANRVVLAGVQAALAEEHTRLQAKSGRTPEDDQRLTDLDGKLKGVHAIAERLNLPPSRERQQAFLLGLNADGNGRAIVAMGNPDTATNVATLVPGTKSSLSGGTSYLEHADAMAEAARKQGSPSTAVISWVGYDAPQSVAAAANEDYATNAKQDLARFQEGLRATHEGQPSHNTVVGHSYGSTVVGHTARDLTIQADEVVFIGSPGVGVHQASELNLPPERVHSSTAQHDVIKYTNINLGLDRDVLPLDPLGPDPTDKRFGGNTFTSDPGTEGWLPGGLSEAAHNEYWAENSRSLKNMGKIIAGRPTD